MAFGNHLIDVHIWFREELAGLRADVETYLDGQGRRPQGLRAHCLSFCTALTRHHTGEDGTMFPALAARYPALRPAIEELSHDHKAVDGMLHRLQELVDGLGADPGPDEARRVRGELDGLAALLESHFRYEEKKLVAVLNGLGIPG